MELQVTKMKYFQVGYTIHVSSAQTRTDSHVSLLLNTQTLFKLIQNSFKLTGINKHQQQGMFLVPNTEPTADFLLHTQMYQSEENGGLANSLPTTDPQSSSLQSPFPNHMVFKFHMHILQV